VGQVLTKTGAGNYATGWANASGGASNRFSLYRSSNYATNGSASEKIPMDTARFTVGGSLVSGGFQPSVEGWWRVHGFCWVATNNVYMACSLFKNAATFASGTAVRNHYEVSTVEGDVYLTTSDVAYLFAFHNQSATFQCNSAEISLHGLYLGT
jgi:hypothetical protein